MSRDELLHEDDVQRADDGRPAVPGMEERTGYDRSNTLAIIAVVLVCLVALLVGATLVTQSINDSKTGSRALTGGVAITSKK